MSGKRCTECAHAHWRVTPSGMLHRSGDGMCVVQPPPPPPLPKCMPQRNTTSNLGGYINRQTANYSDCPLFSPKEEAKP